MSTPAFRSALRRFQFRWRAGLLLAGLLRGLALAALALLALGIFDYYGGFSDPARLKVARFLAGLAVFGAVWALWDAITFMRRDAAGEADHALGSDRRSALSALEMQSDSTTTPLGVWLRDRAVHTAGQQLDSLPFSRSLPLGRIGRRASQAVLIGAAIGAFALLMPAAFQTITHRLLDPRADIPPYSPLQFVLGPRPAEVLYGGELLITTDISGGLPEAPVRCLTRDPATGTIEESPAFQENAGRFSRKLEKVGAPVEVAFAVGRARSAWLPVNVRMQPKVQDVFVTVEPPSYSGLPRREFALGTQELSALPGSRITAKVTSNRPLHTGTLRLESSAGPVQDLAADREDTHRVRFSWTAKGPARLTFTVSDVLGTASEPLQAEQKLLPDERPEVAMRQPAGDLLATPDTELPLEATARDDFGLTRVALVRKLVGYRERAQSEPVKTGDRRHEVSGKLNLAAFGVVPGQTIELTLEAGDTNPSMLGVSVSEPARIHIITRDKYAEMLRQQTTLQEFADRYAALHDAMEEARKSLDELEQAAKTGDNAKAEEARKKSFEAHQRAAQTFAKIAKDFPIFDLDQGLADASRDVAERLYDNGKDLDELNGAGAKELADAVPELKKRLGESQKRMEKEMQKGERAVAAAKVIEQAGKFKELLERQRELVKDFDRTVEQIRRGETQAGQALKDLAKRQREIAEGLREMEKEMGQALKELPDEFAKMKEEGQKFLDLLKEADVPPVMDDAAKTADAADGKAADEKATEALKRLEELLRKKNGICSMCQGGDGEMKFPWPQDLDQTMQQLMQSLIPRPGQGTGQGDGKKPGMGESGPSGSGSSDSGYSMQGKMPQLPMYGPPRTNFSKKANPAMSGQGKTGNGQGKGNPESGADVGSNALNSKSPRNPGGEGAAVEAVPEAYREAVKRFFSNESNTESRKP
jgi:hypothetical protein